MQVSRIEAKLGEVKGLDAGARAEVTMSTCVWPDAMATRHSFVGGLSHTRSSQTQGVRKWRESFGNLEFSPPGRDKGG